ncbi:MAG: hypothetical protein JXA94_04470 [Parachlamydiales bacterium]|nr:hypothetical protein [Parachlamydiales bacterium]
MNQKDEMHIFRELQEEVLDNLGALRVSLEQCKDYGMDDTDDELYNEILSLEEDTKSSESKLEISAVIQNAKSLEKKIEYYFETQGISSIGIEWPDIE